MKKDIVVYAPGDEYASFPLLARTDRELVLYFHTQNLDKLRADKDHPHAQKVAESRWAVSKDGGVTWTIHTDCPALGRFEYSTYGTVARKDGGIALITFSASAPPRVILQNGCIGHRFHQFDNESGRDGEEIKQLGSHTRFYPHSVTRMKNGTLIAAGYAPAKAPGDEKASYTLVFLVSKDDGRTWAYKSELANTSRLMYCEPCIIETDDGRLLAAFRADWVDFPTHEPPDNGQVGVGYSWIYQSESSDGGSTWSDPVKTPVWGHPPHLLKLASGNVLMFVSHRRRPYEVRCVLSRDHGRTWDMDTLKTIHRFEPGCYDFGYPMATQLADGSIVCTFYGYSTPDIGHKMPHGIFVSIFDEEWIDAR